MLMAAVVCLVWAGCVTTADCDEHVGCPDGQVCYQSQCLEVCEGDADCAEQQRCSPCIPDDSSGQGRCLGADENACIDDNTT